MTLPVNMRGKFTDPRFCLCDVAGDSAMCFMFNQQCCSFLRNMRSLFYSSICDAVVSVMCATHITILRRLQQATAHKMQTHYTYSAFYVFRD